MTLAPLRARFHRLDGGRDTGLSFTASTDAFAIPLGSRTQRTSARRVLNRGSPREPGPWKGGGYQNAQQTELTPAARALRRLDKDSAWLAAGAQINTQREPVSRNFRTRSLVFPSFSAQNPLIDRQRFGRCLEAEFQYPWT